jgi:hypothetical protein
MTLRGFVAQPPRLREEATTAMSELLTHSGTHAFALCAPTYPLC